MKIKKSILVNLIPADKLSDEIKQLNNNDIIETYIEDMLQNAVIKCDPEDIKWLIENGNDVNRKGSILDSTALHVACNLLKFDTVKCLVEHRANVNAQTSKGDTPLHDVAFFVKEKTANSKEIYDYLLEHGADDSIKNNDNITPAEATVTDYYSVSNNDGETTLIKKSDIDDLMLPQDKAFFNKVGKAKLHFCNDEDHLNQFVAKNRASKVKKMIAKGVDVNAPDNTGFTPVMVAVQFGKLKMLKLLVKAGADLTGKDNFDSLMFTATVRNHTSIIEYLKAKGIN